VTPFGKVAATIGVVWLAGIAIATVWFVANIDRHTQTVTDYFRPDGSAYEPGTYPSHTIHVTTYPAGYVTVLVVGTVVAVVALVIARVWAERKS
jgi:hypothetical protein